MAFDTAISCTIGMTCLTKPYHDPQDVQAGVQGGADWQKFPFMHLCSSISLVDGQEEH